MSVEVLIKDARKAAGLTQEKAAELIGVTVNTIQNWESGNSKPTYDNVEMIAKIYHISAKKLAAEMVNEPEISNSILEDNFPDFLFRSEELEELNTHFFTEEMQELFGYLYAYADEKVRNSDKVYYFNSVEQSEAKEFDRQLFDLKHLPYEYYREHKNPYYTSQLIAKIKYALNGFNPKKVFHYISDNPNVLFSIRTIPKEEICDYIDGMKLWEVQCNKLWKEHLLTSFFKFSYAYDLANKVGMVKKGTVGFAIYKATEEWGLYTLKVVDIDDYEVVLTEKGCKLLEWYKEVGEKKKVKGTQTGEGRE